MSSFFRSRHPGDLLRLVLGAALLLLTAVVVEQGRVGRFETNLFRLINALPDPGPLYPVVWSIMQLGNLGAVPATAAAAALTTRWRLAFDFLVAGGTIYVVAKIVKQIVHRGRPLKLLDGVNVLGQPAGGLGYVSGHAAVAIALATVAAPYLGRRARRVVWILALLVCVFRVYVGAHLPWDVVGGAALGWMAGATAHLLLGAPDGHPSAERLRRVLTDWGWKPMEVRAVRPPSRRSATFFVKDEAKGDIFIKTVSRERRDDDFLYRAWRLIKDHHIVHDPIFGSPTRLVEHEAFMSLLARANGVRVPEVLLARSFGNGGGILCQEWVHGVPLSGTGEGALDERILRDLREQVRRLDVARISHGQLVPQNFLVDDEKRVWITNFAGAEPEADRRAIQREETALLDALRVVREGSGRTDNVRVADVERAGEADRP